MYKYINLSNKLPVTFFFVRTDGCQVCELRITKRDDRDTLAIVAMGKTFPTHKASMLYCTLVSRYRENFTVVN